MTRHYAYYPGCSLMESAVEYDRSVRHVMDILDVSLTEIPDWTCCGASAMESVSRLLSYALPARNLALVERDMDVDDILVPCSACCGCARKRATTRRCWPRSTKPSR
ncbi:MAG: heterodisulfide reductase-related iron-sulfur binding cluster [Oceanidesulfovibrio sp.]